MSVPQSILNKIPKSSRRKIKVRRNYQYAGYLYILPWLIGLLIFQLYPFISSLYYSFTDYNMVSAPKWVGLDNYHKIFTEDPDFYQSLKVTGIYVLLAVPVKLAFALFVAMLLSAKLKAINFFRTVYYLPSILGGSVAISVLWRFLFMKEGVVNSLLPGFILDQSTGSAVRTLPYTHWGCSLYGSSARPWYCFWPVFSRFLMICMKPVRSTALPGSACSSALPYLC